MKVLVVKQLTFSDSSYEVSKTGRVVLPRSQVQDVLAEVLRRGGAAHAVATTRAPPGAPLRLAVDLNVIDQHGQKWAVALKTWQNLVSGQHRPTFVLENTAAFMMAHGMRQGDVLALCELDGALQLRTDIPLPRQGPEGAAVPKASKVGSPRSCAATKRPAPPSKQRRTPRAAKRNKAPPDEEPSDIDVQAAHVLMSMLSSESISPGSRSPTPAAPSSGTAGSGAIAKQEVSDESATCSVQPVVAQECTAQHWYRSCLAAPPTQPAMTHTGPSPIPAHPVPAATALRYSGGGSAITTGCTFRGTPHCQPVSSSVYTANWPLAAADQLLERMHSLPRMGSLQSERTAMHAMLSPQPCQGTAPPTSLPPFILERALPMLAAQRSGIGGGGGSTFAQAIALEAVRSGLWPFSAFAPLP